MIQTNCRNCEKIFHYAINRSGGIYCSNKCQQAYQRNEIIVNWKLGLIDGNKVGVRLKNPIRTYILNKFENKCSSCGWCEINPVTGKSPLEVDHIDGNSENTKEDNLRVLCPNCHSLTENYKALNKGKASKKRLAYSRLITAGSVA